MFSGNAAAVTLFSSVLLLIQACEKVDDIAANPSIPKKEVALQEEMVSTDVIQTDDLITDENLFIFSADNTGDTSFVIVLKKERSTISATYYELLPHQESNEHAGRSSQLLNFEGLHFTIPASKWKSIIQKSAPLLESTYSIPYKEQRDGSKFTLAHNSKVKFCNDLSNVMMAAAFRELEDHIKDVLGKDIFQKKLRSSVFAFK
jgi:hypothetical protein